MKAQTVVAMKYLPTKLPFVGTLAWGLFLDRLHAPPLVWGIWVTLMALVWIAVVVAVHNQEPVHPSEIEKR